MFTRNRRVIKIIVKVFFVLFVFAIVVFAVFVLVFDNKSSSAQPNFRPVEVGIPDTLKRKESGIASYNRPEESTYLSFPEWYLVFCPQEYAQFIKNNRPSRFPYFTSIQQFWFGYGQVYGITKRNFQFNAGDHLMLMVIGTSSTLEYAIKGLYEETIGRVSEWISSGERTEEDAYAAQVAKEYGDFIPTDPWYEFPFTEKFLGVWTKNSLSGPHWFRKWERKAFLTSEFGIKAAYGWIIKLGTHAVYGVADTEVYVSAENVSESIFEDPRVRKVKGWGDHAYIITVPHYQGFTEVVPGLARQGIHFIDIAGNDEILLTAIAPENWTFDLRGGSMLFTMKMLASQGSKRIAIQTPVQSLDSILMGLEKEGVKLEHLYDY